MNTEMVAPFQLHRMLDRGQSYDAVQRKQTISQVLDSGILAVIRRIPKTMSPFSDEEKNLIVSWATNQAQDTDVSDRDFTFHMLANCHIPADRILAILEENRTFSRSALEHIQQIFGTNDPIQQLNSYLAEVAKELLKNIEIRPRDRGRHMLMTLARTEEDWQVIATRFSVDEIADLRQRIIERFLQECPDGEALRMFVENIVKMCLAKIGSESGAWPSRLDVTMMHWVISCLERVGDSGRLMACARAFRDRFTRLYSVGGRVDSALIFTSPDKEREVAKVVLPRPAVSQPVVMESVVATRSCRPAAKPAVQVEVKPPEPPMVWRPREVAPIPVLGNDKETNAQIAARLGITKDQVIAMKKKGLLKG